MDSLEATLTSSATALAALTSLPQVYFLRWCGPPALPLYRVLKLPEWMERKLAHWSARPSLRWVERIYAEHRTNPAPI